MTQTDVPRLVEAADAGGQVARQALARVTDARGTLAKASADLCELDHTLRVAQRDLTEGDAAFDAVCKKTVPRSRLAARLPLAFLAVSGVLTVAGIAMFVAGVAAGPRPTPPEESAVSAAAASAAPKPATDPLNDGLAAMRAGDYAEAVTQFRKARAAGANPTLALGGLAEALFYLNQDADALAACDELNRTVPNAGRAHYVRGLVLLRQGKKEQAYAELTLAARHGERLAVTLLPKGHPAKEPK
jgi:tetratricopeptide (TPR) repeat protein